MIPKDQNHFDSESIRQVCPATVLWLHYFSHKKIETFRNEIMFLRQTDRGWKT